MHDFDRHPCLECSAEESGLLLPRRPFLKGVGGAAGLSLFGSIRYLMAEAAGNESDRAKYIVATHKKYLQVIATIDSLRSNPTYADEDEQFKKGYEFLDKYSGEASQTLGDILKRSKTTDSFN